MRHARCASRARHARPANRRRFAFGGIAAVLGLFIALAWASGGQHPQAASLAAGSTTTFDQQTADVTAATAATLDGGDTDGGYTGGSDGSDPYGDPLPPSIDPYFPTNTTDPSLPADTTDPTTPGDNFAPHLMGLEEALFNGSDYELLDRRSDVSDYNGELVTQSTWIRDGHPSLVVVQGALVAAYDVYSPVYCTPESGVYRDLTDLLGTADYVVVQASDPSTAYTADENGKRQTRVQALTAAGYVTYTCSNR